MLRVDRIGNLLPQPFFLFILLIVLIFILFYVLSRPESFHLPPSSLKSLRELGYRTRLYDGLNGWFGRAHALQIGLKKYRTADPSDFGAAKGVDE